MKKKKQNIDFELVKELDMVIENEYSDYQKEDWLAKNYLKKWNKNKFNFGMAQKGVKNLIVVPRVRSYQNQFKMKIGNKERDAIAKARLRRIMRRLKENREIK